MISFLPLAMSCVLPTTNSALFAAQQTHLVTCVKTVLLRHFTSGESLLISLPGNGHDHLKFVELMLQNIHEETLWAIYTYRPQAEQIETALRHEENFSICIMFTWLEEGESDVTINLIPQLRNVIAKGLLNTHAHMFVVMTDCVDSLGQTALSTVETLWTNFNVFDVLVLFPVSDPDGMTRCHLYTWFPFHSSGGQEILLDEFTPGTNGLWDSSKNLFPSKIPTRFQNYNEITVLTSEINPSILLSKNYTKGNKTVLEFKGPEVDFLASVLGTLNLSHTYSALRRDNTTDFLALMAQLSRGNLDLVIGALPLHEFLASYAAPTFPYYFTGYKWYVPCPRPVARTDKVTHIFHSSAWLSLITSFVTVSVVMRGYGGLFKSNESRAYQTLSNCFYNAWAVAFGVSVHHKPTTSELKVIFLLWVCYCYVISTVFQTFFTSFLINPGFDKPIQSYEELVASGVECGLGAGSETLLFENYSEFTPQEILPRSRMCLGHKKCLFRTLKDSNFATLQVEFFAEYFATIYLPRQENLLCSLQDYFRILYVAMYLPKGSHILPPLNRATRRTVESGLVTKWISDMEEPWKIKGSAIVTEGSSADGYYVFTVSHLQIAFSLLACGIFLSFIVLFAETMYRPNGCN
jgi:hypothetical protein